MGFSMDISVPVLTVFLQGLLSFFSPCVLPLLPLYIGYLSGGTARRGEDGRITYERKKVMLHTVFFVLGVSSAFFILGLGGSALGRFFKGNRPCSPGSEGFLLLASAFTSWGSSDHPGSFPGSTGCRFLWERLPCLL